jgi:hypothetical protein
VRHGCEFFGRQFHDFRIAERAFREASA